MPNLIEDILDFADNTPDQFAISNGLEQISYAELKYNVENVAQQALKAGVRKGAKFLFLANPTPVSVTIALGLIQAGMVMVIDDPRTAQNLFESRVGLIYPKYVVADSSFYAFSSKTFNLFRNLNRIHAANIAVSGAKHLYIGMKTIGIPRDSLRVDKEWMRVAPDNFMQLPNLDSNDDLVIIFTSGTVENPTGIVHTMGSISATADAYINKLDIKSGTSIFSESLIAGITALKSGAEWRIPKRGEWLTDCDVYYASSGETLLQMDQLGTLPLDKRPVVKTLVVGGTPVLNPLLEKVHNVMGESTKVYAAYGIPEVLPLAIIDSKEKLAFSGLGDDIGTPLEGTEVKKNLKGEILAKGTNVMKEYVAYAKNSSPWISTGLSGKVTSDGNHIVITSHPTDVLFRNGKRIHPSLYEPALSKIEGVEKAILVGITDLYGNDLITLVIEPKDTKIAHLLLQFKVEKEMGNFMDMFAIPDQVIVVEKIPTTGRSQLVDYVALKETIIPLLNATEPN